MRAYTHPVVLMLLSVLPLAACSDPAFRANADAGDAAARDSDLDAAEDALAGDAEDAALPDDAEPQHDAKPQHDAAPQDDAGPPPDSGAPTGFASIDGLDAPARARRIGGAHVTTARRLLALPDRRSWLYWRSYPDPSFQGGSAYLQLFGADGALSRHSPLETLDLDDVFLTHEGALRGWRSRCGDLKRDVCLYQETSSTTHREQVWPMLPRDGIIYELDWSGDVVRSEPTTFKDRGLQAVASGASGLYALTRDYAYQMHRLDDQGVPAWSVEILPAVQPPDVPIDGPLDPLLKANNLVYQWATEPIATEEGVLLALGVARGSVAALNQAHQLALPLPTDPLCADVLLVHVRSDGSIDYRIASTDACDRLSMLSVVGRHAFVASWVQRDRPPEPNDTYEYDIGLSIFDLDSDAVWTRQIDMSEDDMVHAVAPCGDYVCLAGLTGSRSVNTGSRVTYGNGFILPLNAKGEMAGPRVNLTSPRHSEFRLLAAGGDALLFFATSDGPITHTADVDKWLGYNRGWLGFLSNLPHGTALPLLP